MKFFCYIFSLYFLALSVVPCTDIHATNGSASAELASISTDNHSDCPHENGQDFCSPFCVCSCCAHVLSVAKPHKWNFQPPIIPDFKEKSNFYYSKDWQSEYLNSIFRPPKV